MSLELSIILISLTIMFLIIIISVSLYLIFSPKDNREPYLRQNKKVLALKIIQRNRKTIRHEDIIHGIAPHQDPYVEYSLGISWLFPFIYEKKTSYYPFTVNNTPTELWLPLVEEKVKKYNSKDVKLVLLDKKKEKKVYLIEDERQDRRGVLIHKRI